MDDYPDLPRAQYLGIVIHQRSDGRYVVMFPATGNTLNLFLDDDVTDDEAHQACAAGDYRSIAGSYSQQRGYLYKKDDDIDFLAPYSSGEANAEANVENGKEEEAPGEAMPGEEVQIEEVDGDAVSFVGPLSNWHVTGEVSGLSALAHSWERVGEYKRQPNQPHVRVTRRAHGSPSSATEPSCV